ncbi:MAG TPA: hypothetical protein VFW88_07035, partial [Burkholderiales bacterium]|nr:hypothetical protein [Burkholderiales bacterium]
MAKMRVPVRGTPGKFARVNTDATNGAQLGVNLYDENGNLLTSADLLNKLLTVNGAALKKFIDRDGTISADALRADKIISGRINQWVKALQHGQITSDSVLNGAIGTLALAEDAVTSEKIAALAVTAAALANGAIADPAKFASNIQPVSIVDTLPDPAGYSGPPVVLLTADKKLYRYDASVPQWVKTVPATDLTGQIVSTQITDGAISTPKLAVGAVTAEQIAANTITAAQLAANTITAGEIAAGAIGTDQLAAGAITADKIGAGEVDATAIAAGAVVAAAIAAGAVTAEKIAVGSLSAIVANAGILSAGVLVDSSATAPDYTDYHLAFDMDDQILEMKDASGNTRVLMGQTSPGVYNFEIADADGNLLFDADGISD